MKNLTAFTLEDLFSAETKYQLQLKSIYDMNDAVFLNY